MRILIFFLLFSSIIAYGQGEKDMLHIRSNVSPVSINGNKDALYGLDVGAKFPLMLRDSALLVGGVGYERLWTDQDPLFGITSVQGISSMLAFNRNLSRGRGLFFAITAGIYSDFKDISGEDFRYTLAGRYKTTLHEKFTLSYGLAISRQFFGVMVAPFMDFDWKPSKRLRLSGPFPLNTRLRYLLTRKSEITFFLKPDNATYRLSKDANASAYFQKKQWNAGLGFDQMLTRHWLLMLRTGYALKRTFEVYDATQTGFLSILTRDVHKKNKRTPIYQYEETAFFGEVTLAWVIGKD